KENNFVAVHTAIILRRSQQFNQKRVVRITLTLAAEAKDVFNITPPKLLACKADRLTSRKAHDHKKYWNAVACHLFDSCRNHDALSRWDWSNCHGYFGAGRGHFDFGRQIV